MPQTINSSDTRLPDNVRDLAHRLGVAADTTRSAVRLTQTGRIRRSLSAEAWMTFTAVQTISALECSFDWQAQTGPFGVVTACDAIKDGKPRFDIMAFGLIPIARATPSAALLRGELMRYLAELPMAPDAMLRNRALSWRDDGPDAIGVSAGAGDGRAEVRLLLGTDGRVKGAFAPDRPRSANKDFLPTPWHCQFSDYRPQNGLWLPFQGEVAWEIDGKRIAYWRGQVTSWTAT